MSNEISFRIANPNGRREFVMVVDDDSLVASLVERVLTGEGYQVITACDGFQALEMYKRFQSRIQLVLLDLNMPGMNGMVVFQELLIINPQVQAILTTGFIDDNRLKEMLAKGLRGYLQKPLTQKELLLQVRKTLDAAWGPSPA
jgi:CheY-like chemotaxis protein